MKILVFYRSKEYTNAIISSTKAKLAANKNVKGLDVEFINLDKRNYIKVLTQMDEIPRFVYIWFDEEKITDYIHETYPSIEVIHFNQENSMIKQYDSRYGYLTREYKLADLMIEKFKENLVTRSSSIHCGVPGHIHHRTFVVLISCKHFHGSSSFFFGVIPISISAICTPMIDTMGVEDIEEEIS